MGQGLDMAVAVRLSREQSEALAQIGQYWGLSESELLRKVVMQLIGLWEDAKGQAELGASMDDIMGRSTRFALMELIDRTPEELRRLGDEVRAATYQLAAFKEKQ
jgi:hypothetical protein